MSCRRWFSGTESPMNIYFNPHPAHKPDAVFTLAQSER